MLLYKKLLLMTFGTTLVISLRNVEMRPKLSHLCLFFWGGGINSRGYKGMCITYYGRVSAFSI